jgi:hypothetical protein
MLAYLLLRAISNYQMLLSSRHFLENCVSPVFRVYFTCNVQEFETKEIILEQFNIQFKLINDVTRMYNENDENNVTMNIQYYTVVIYSC